uniref:C2H2-type domain-containing protein n=1 Tax=Musa acuminata subsp. malaccensis TaxID=214687 RepID=A0A804L2G9_MUSAM
MAARLVEGRSHHTTWDAAVAAEEQAHEELTKNTLRLRIKCPKTGDEDREAAAQVAVSPSGDSGVIVDQSTGGADGDLAGDEDANAESASEVKEVVDEGCGSFKRKHANRRAVVPTCPECGKTFPSDKSLFGHLRCHPERDYRGVNPPPGARKKPQPDAYSSIARVPPTTKWSTARRGRKGTAGDRDDEAIAADTLLLLADGKPQRPETTITTEGEDTDTKQIAGTHFAGTDGIGWDQKSADMDAGSYGNELISSYKRSKKRKIKELELVNGSGTSVRCRRYQCSVCFKTFSSHQALGGHRASHNKKKSNPVEAAAIPDENEGGNPKHGEDLIRANGAVIKAEMAEHRCTNCNLTFRSGQALGGHKRRHFNELQHRAPSSSPHSSESDKGANGLLQNRVTSSSAHSSESYKGAKHGLFDFDLNEVPEL